MPEVMFRTSVGCPPTALNSDTQAAAGAVCRMVSRSPSCSADNRLASHGAWDANSEPARHVAPPLFEQSLKRAQLSVRKHAPMLALQTLEERFAGSLWIGLEPVTNCGPHALERAFPRPPMP